MLVVITASAVKLFMWVMQRRGWTWGWGVITGMLLHPETAAGVIYDKTVKGRGKGMADRRIYVLHFCVSSF